MAIAIDMNLFGFQLSLKVLWNDYGLTYCVVFLFVSLLVVICIHDLTILLASKLYCPDLNPWYGFGHLAGYVSGSIVAGWRQGWKVVVAEAYGEAEPSREDVSDEVKEIYDEYEGSTKHGSVEDVSDARERANTDCESDSREEVCGRKKELHRRNQLGLDDEKQCNEKEFERFKFGIDS